MTHYIIKILVKSPLYPHWLNNQKMESMNNEILKVINGNVLEVGAGDGSKKAELLSKHKNIQKYVVTDYSSWDNEFEKFDLISKKYGEIGEIFFGYKRRIKLDSICSATNIPFKEGSFDVHLSFEVLEHIDNPEKYFSEAKRVLKKGLFFIVCMVASQNIKWTILDMQMVFFIKWPKTIILNL